MGISDEVLYEFKSRMKISHSTEDDNLRRILAASYDAIKSSCGQFPLGENERGKELVFERARYVYNDSLEFFDQNFLTAIMNLMLSLKEADEESEGEERSDNL